MAQPVGHFRSGAGSDHHQQRARPPARAGIRRGLRAFSRDAASQASDKTRALPPRSTFAGIPPRRKTILRLRPRDEISETIFLTLCKFAPNYCGFFAAEA